MDEQISKEKGEFDYQIISRPFFEVRESAANQLERDWDPRYRNVDSARVTFFQYVRLAINTYETILYICSDVANDPKRNPNYALSLSPLTRTLFEQLIALLFLLEDIPAYIPYLFKTGHTERIIELEHCEKYYQTDPDWQQYIDFLKQQIVLERTELKLTPDEIANPKKEIGRWPLPGTILRKLQAEHPTSPAIPFIEFINSWLYRKLSGQAHLNAPGLINRGAFFSPRIAEGILGEGWKEKMDELLVRHKMSQVYISITLMLAIVSEIEIHFHYDLSQRLRFIWTVVSEYSDIAKDFWTMRYSQSLPE
jgi:hypothetical protein